MNSQPYSNYFTCISCKESKHNSSNYGTNTCKSCHILEKIDKVRERARYSRIARKRGNKHGMSANDLSSLLKHQNYSCAICKIEQKKLKRRLSLDHDHSTKYIRGLLCDACNTGLGFFRDNPDYLLIAVYYLQNPPFRAWVSQQRGNIK